MKIYHTETQADYDALMVELGMRGIETLENRYWKTYDNQTAVFVRAIGRYGNSTRTDTTYGSLGWALQHYPAVPIQKYKTKADEKMRFTKENVKKVIDDYFWEADFEPCGDLIAEIHNLDDTPKKIVVPKCFDEWYKEIEADHLIHAKTFALWKLCQSGFGYNFERANGEKICYESELGKWLVKDTFLAIDAVLNGYTIEPEKLYYIPLPHLETSDGLQQVLSKRKNDTHYFASRPNENLKQRYTKEELEQVPEVYKPFAKLIEEEEE